MGVSVHQVGRQKFTHFWVLRHVYTHPRKLTCCLKRDHFKRKGLSSNHQLSGAMFVSGRVSHRYSFYFFNIFFSSNKPKPRTPWRVTFSSTMVPTWEFSENGISRLQDMHISKMRCEQTSISFFQKQLTQTQTCFSKRKGIPGLYPLNLT